MALAWVYRTGFETGTNGDFTAETDADSILDFPHYTELARFRMAPYRGAYCMRIRPNGGTNDAYVQEDTAFDDLDANDTTRYLRWYFYLGRNFVMADGDKFAMFVAESTLDTTVEIAAGIDRSGSNIRFWWAETAAASAQTITLGNTTTALGKWYHAELNINMDNGGSNDGTITGIIDDTAGTAVTSLNQADIVDVKFGVIGPDAGTSGTILIDDIIYDDGQIYRDRERFRSSNAHVTFLNDHPIIGPGSFEVALTGTGTDAVLSLYDSDGVPNRLEPIDVIRNTTANAETVGQRTYNVNHGLYCTLTGTAPQAFINVLSGGRWSEGQLISRGLAQGSPKP